MKRVALFVALMVCGPLVSSAAAHHPGVDQALSPVATARALGPGSTATPRGLFKVPLDDGSVVRTHGPDLASAEMGIGGPRDAFLPGAAERAPKCATDYAMQVIYARPPSSQNRLGEVTPKLQSVVRRSNFVFNSESLASGGGQADYKVLCSGGAVDVKTFTTTATAFGDVVNAAKEAGFTSRNRNYTIFLEGDVPGVCGVGSLYDSDTPSLQQNPHNSNGGYAVIYEGCWEGSTFMHEVGHNRGAVQIAAPNSTGNGFHCNQGYDVMCYTPDGGNRNQTMTYPCPVMRFDCGFDDYFDAAPEQGEWLSTHWNLGAQGQNFLIVRPPDPVDPVDPEDPVDSTPPTVSLRASVGGRTSSRKATFDLAGTDETSDPAELTFECSIDAAGFVPCTSPVMYRKLTRGRHDFEVRSIDQAGNAATETASYRWKITRR